MFGISIEETDNLIKAIYNHYQLDLSGYTLNHLRFRIRKVLDRYYLKKTGILINRLIDDEVFFDEFLFDISTASTEMFRDPDMWMILRNSILLSIAEKPDPLRIWLPRCVAGDELFSTVILLDEARMMKRSVIHASTLSFRSQDIIRSGIFTKDKLEISKNNYQSSGGKKNFYSYFQSKKNLIERKTSLIKNVRFKKQSHELRSAPDSIDLILFRNQLLSFKQELKNKILNRVTGGLKEGGYLILGGMESLTECDISNQFKLAFEKEKIYIKKS